jgi:hypothetical protein
MKLNDTIELKVLIQKKGDHPRLTNSEADNLLVALQHYLKKKGYLFLVHIYKVREQHFSDEFLSRSLEKHPVHPGKFPKLKIKTCSRTLRQGRK